MLFTLILSLIFNFSLLPSAPPVNTGQVLGTAINIFSGQQIAGDNTTSEIYPIRINPENLDVKISAPYGLAVNMGSGQILWEKNKDEIRSIASITKLMTAVVFLDTVTDLNQPFSLITADITDGSKLVLAPGEQVTLLDLLHLSLISSDNSATMALVRASGLTMEKFIERMNMQAEKWGLPNTRFVDPVGLKAGNVSTAVETALLMKKVNEHSVIKDILAKSSYTFQSSLEKKHTITSTNKLINSYLNILAGKTGFTEEAGNCFVAIVKLTNNQKIITVVLGSSSANARFQDTKALAAWITENYQW